MKTINSFADYISDEERVSRQELEIVRFEKELILKMVEIREADSMTQRELARISGVKQPAIARLENRKSTPQIDTLLKLLVPLGYTLDIVPLRRA